MGFVTGKKRKGFARIPAVRGPDTKTSAGLYNLAAQSGLQRDADRILEAQKGEETKKIFSGGFISDVFDVLNSLQYGVTGMLKGKGFAEGVRTRQSFSDKDALGDNGLPGVIAGIGMDIAVDPLTYIAPWTIAKKIPAISKLAKGIKGALFGKMVPKTIKTAEGAKKVQQLEGGTRLGKYLGRKVSWMFGADPVFKETWERGLKNTAVGTQNLAEIARGITKLTPKTAAKILTRDKTGRIARVPLAQLKKTLSPEEFETVATAWNKLDDLGKQAVDLKLLSKGKFEENFGEYLKNAYLEYEQRKSKGLFKFAKVGVKGIKKRRTPEELARGYLASLGIKKARKLYPKSVVKAFGKDVVSTKKLSKETIDKLAKKGFAQTAERLGQIEDPTYLLFKSTFDLFKDVENTKLFNTINKGWASDVAQTGFKQLPKTKRLGSLSGKWIPENISDYVNEISQPIKYGIGKKLVADFKFFKVVMNPATHARNIVSNRILNWWKLGMNPLDPRTIKAEAESLKEIAKGGGKWMNQAKTAGYNVDTFLSQEITHMLDSPEALAWGKKLGNKWGNLKKSIGKIYQGEENQAKLAAFIFNRKHRGLGIEDAWKAAESATFNYAQVTPFVRKLRESLFGFPFITFTTKATPVAIETALKHPRRISAFGKIKTAIENQADIKVTDRERASEPPWVRDGFYIKLPMKDKHGRSSYFDLTYIIPFGDLVSGQFVERQVKRDTGVKESLLEAGLGKAPALNLIKELSRNQDFYGNKIWKESDSTEKQTADLFRHLSKAYLPPLVADQIPGGYNKRGERQQRGFIGAAMTPEDELNQKRTVMQEMLRQVGAKLQPMDVDIQESYQEWNQKKALETLLKEKGILRGLDISYVPK
jgi:hypothetical protein